MTAITVCRIKIDREPPSRGIDSQRRYLVEEPHPGLLKEKCNEKIVKSMVSSFENISEDDEEVLFY